ncbi:MAG TPA: hypothetical protein VMZ25_06490 [Terriglobales bacterium]|nr:hypothetical protein [Terriglobales bacterium]
MLPYKMPLRLLSIGVASDIFSTRNAVLRQAGFLVDSTTDLGEAVRLFRNADFNSAVICHLIPTRQKEQLIRQLKELKPLTPIVSVTDGTGGPGADVEVFNLDGPEVLLSSLHQAIDSSDSPRV